MKWFDNIISRHGYIKRSDVDSMLAAQREEIIHATAALMAKAQIDRDSTISKLATDIVTGLSEMKTEVLGAINPGKQ